MSAIDLVEFTRGRVRNLSGYERGRAARDVFRLDDLDLGDSQVEVRVPKEMIAISTSFFQGMFAESVDRLGGRDGFLAKYTFETDEVIERQVHRGLDAILTDRELSPAA